MRLVVAEDSLLVREWLSRVLGEMGHADAGVVVRGETVVDQDLVEALLNRARTDDPLQVLTPRERDVLALMAQGLSDRGIAARLSVSLPTVGTHVRGVYQKLAISAGAADNRRVGAV